jgi:molybdenum cofactor biosynthesis protein B
MSAESPSTLDHKAKARSAVPDVRCAVVTLSDTRSLQDDASGKLICDLLASQKQAVARRELIKDDPQQLAALLEALLADATVQAILTTGGTGVARRDNTIGVVESRVALLIPGFGELFRSISYAEIGSAAMMSRAVAGVLNAADGRRVPIFCMPGSAHAVELAMRKLVLPELKHLVWELGR